MGDQPGEINQEKMVSDLKTRLEGWREVFLILDSLLLWKNLAHTGILFGGISFIFLLIWWCDLALITLISTMGILVICVDYLGPIIIRSVFDASKWNNKKEANFEEICKSIVLLQITCFHYFNKIRDLKANQPTVFYLAANIILLSLAAIGEIMDNLLLTYILVIALCLIPGFRHNNPIKTCILSLFQSGSDGKFGKKGKIKAN